MDAESRKTEEIRKELEVTKYLSSVKDNIRDWRRLLKLTQRQLADKSGLHQVSIARYETGQNIPTLEAVYKLSKAFKIHPKELLDI